MSNMQIDSVLAQIRSLQPQTKIGAPQLRPTPELGGARFGRSRFAAQLRQCAAARAWIASTRRSRRATDIATTFERGAPGVELSQVMLEIAESHRVVPRDQSKCATAWSVRTRKS